jgi:nitric-oxide synthase
MISIFAPIEQGRLPAYIENAQISQYAGYLQPGGRISGDPLNVEFTRIATSLGWQPPDPPGPFDLLPLIIRDAQGQRRLYELPEGLVREVEIAHADFPGIASLGLKWYAVPCVSDMVLTVGGIDYPCAPFNGYYMATEIASRDLVDPFRYDLLEAVGRAVGVDLRDPLWKDFALLELNRAVLQSFEAAQVTIVDHHRASSQFVDFAQREHALGRMPSANWSWIVPPQASAASPTFHMPMRDLTAVPNFYRSRAIDGGELHVSRETEQRSVSRQRWDRAVRRWRKWHRRRA